MRAQTRANRIRLVQSHIAFQKLRSCHDKSGPIAAKNKRSVFGSNVSENLLFIIEILIIIWITINQTAINQIAIRLQVIQIHIIIIIINNQVMVWINYLQLIAHNIMHHQHIQDNDSIYIYK